MATAARVACRDTLASLDVLVVEDSVGASGIMTVVLADAGATVRLGVDFDSALQLCEQKWHDLLISDIGLPGRDGYELIREVRQRKRTRGQTAAGDDLWAKTGEDIRSDDPEAICVVGKPCAISPLQTQRR